MMHALRDIVGNVRAMLGYAVVNDVDDTGGAQMLSVTTGDGVQRAEVEVVQPFGFSSVPPPDGAVTLLLSVGADPGNLVALSVANPSARFGKLGPGEAIIYGGDGSRVHIRQGGAIEIWGGTSVTVNTKTATVNATTAVDVTTETATITAPAGTIIDGPVTINGPLTVNQAVGDAATLNGDFQLNGSLTATGDLSDGHGALNRLRTNYDAHSHPPTVSTPPNPLDPE